MVVVQHQRVKKVSRGRQKIEIKKIEQTNHRQVAFSKRRGGLFKKAGEIAMLCGAEIAIITFSERDRAFSFGHPDADVVINRYLSGNEKIFPNSSEQMIKTNCPHVEELNMYCEEAMKILEEEKKKGKVIERSAKNENYNRGIYNNEVWWWDLPIGNMALEELEGYMDWLIELRQNMAVKINEHLTIQGEVPALDSLPYFNDLPPPKAAVAMNHAAEFDNQLLINDQYEGCSNITTALSPQQPHEFNFGNGFQYVI